MLNGEERQFEDRAIQAFHFANLEIGSRPQKFHHHHACTELQGELPKVVAVAVAAGVLQHLNDLCKEGQRKGYWDVEVAAVGPTVQVPEHGSKAMND